MTILKEETFVDKTGWVEGPWMSEPDRVEWRSEAAPDIALLIVRGNMGQLCGYVGLPPGHPWHGKDYMQPDVSVHGGLTYASPCDEEGRICHVPQPGEPDAVWWLGFDCAHGGDYWYMQHGPNSEVAQKIGGIMGSGVYTPPPPSEDRWLSLQGTYRDLAYVRAEVESLAAQCVAATQPASTVDD